MRIEFTEPTKRVLAGRAGYQCSHPDCEAITIGPGDKYDQTSSIGEAAHIYSAAKNGPRGQDGLTEAELRSINNGIWLCKIHARIIDTNKGEGFTASQLISWKHLHEEAIKRRQGRIHRNIGWVSKIRIIESPVIANNSVIELGKVTLIESEFNYSGKTAICEWISSISTTNNISRWIPSRNKDTKYVIDVFTPEKHEVYVEIIGSDYKLQVDGKELPFSPISIRSYFLNKETYQHTNKEGLKESEYLCRVLDVELHVLKKLFSCIGISAYSKVRRLFHDEITDDLNDIICDVRGTVDGLPFFGLSSGEQDCVIFELLVAKMQSFAEFNPLLLIIESSQTSIALEQLVEYINLLNSSEISFQTIVTSLSDRIPRKYAGFSHYLLHGKGRNVEVIQA